MLLSPKVKVGGKVDEPEADFLQNRMASVFSQFSLSLLVDIHVSAWATQCCKEEIVLA